MGLPRHTYRTWTASDVRSACRLYAVTDPRWLKRCSLASVVAEALVGGATFVQLREKGKSSLDLARTARSLGSVCRVANVPLVVNDDLEAVKMSGADGIHVGQADISCAQARKELGEEAIVGVSVQTVDQARAAEAAGASYLGVGAVFNTATKQDADLVALSTLRDICDAVQIPVMAIGGIGAKEVPRLAGTGISGVAVVSALFAAPDVEEAARTLRATVDECL